MKRCQTTLGNARRPSDECTKTSPENSLNYQPPWVWTISRCGNQASVALKFRCCFTESDFGSRSTLRNRGYTSTEIRTPPATGEPEATIRYQAIAAVMIMRLRVITNLLGRGLYSNFYAHSDGVVKR